MTEKKYRWPEIREKWEKLWGFPPRAEQSTMQMLAVSGQMLRELLGFDEELDYAQAEDLISEMREALEEKKAAVKRTEIEERWLALIRKYLGDDSPAELEALLATKAPPPIRTGVALQKLLEDEAEDARVDRLCEEAEKPKGMIVLPALIGRSGEFSHATGIFRTADGEVEHFRGLYPTPCPDCGAEGLHKCRGKPEPPPGPAVQSITSFPDSYPHRCPSCGSPAYVGATKVECTREGCPHHK